jgi:hypothetical protein
VLVSLVFTENIEKLINSELFKRLRSDNEDLHIVIREELPKWNFARTIRDDGSVHEITLPGLIRRRNAEI